MFMKCLYKNAPASVLQKTTFPNRPKGSPGRLCFRAPNILAVDERRPVKFNGTDIPITSANLSPAISFEISNVVVSMTKRNSLQSFSSRVASLQTTDKLW